MSRLDTAAFAPEFLLVQFTEVSTMNDRYKNYSKAAVVRQHATHDASVARDAPRGEGQEAESGEAEVTAEMTAAGEEIIAAMIGMERLPVYFSVADLVTRVYRAMARLDLSARNATAARRRIA